MSVRLDAFLPYLLCYFLNNFRKLFRAFENLMKLGASRNVEKVTCDSREVTNWMTLVLGLPPMNSGTLQG
jgi:hypothetical protein